MAFLLYSNMEQMFFKHSEGVLAYSKFGTGEKVLFCFHGFGLDKSIFCRLSDDYKSNYTIYAFDLYYHGESIWENNRLVLTDQRWSEIINVFLKKENISKFDLIGYSLGGNFVLALAYHLPMCIEKIILIAPDGIIENNWYKWLTEFSLSRYIFKLLMKNKSILYKGIHLAKQIGLAPASTDKFVLSQLKTQKQRYQVYHSWVVLRGLKINSYKLSKKLSKKPMPICLILGKYDKIIKNEDFDKFIKNTRGVNLMLLEAGHTNVFDKFTKLKVNNISY